MTHNIGDLIKIVDVANVPLRNQEAFIRFVDFKNGNPRYFCRSKNGKEAWVLERDIDTGGNPRSEKLVPISDLVEATGLSLDALRNACYRGSLKCAKEGRTYYTTLNAVWEYKEHCQSNKVRGNARKEEG